jgi:hypothetical protein
MLRIRVIATTAALGLAIIGTGSAATAASAAARPSVTFTFAKNRVITHQAVTVTYSSRRLPRGSGLYLQRQFGSARVWKNVSKLHGTSGTQKIAGVPQGRYSFRVRARRDGRTLAVSPTRRLYSYGPVSIAVLCNNPKVNINTDNGCPDSGSTQVGNHVFPYKVLVSDNDSSVYPTFFNLIDFPATTCRSITFTFGMPQDASQSGDTGYIEAVEQTLDPQVGHVGFGALRTFRVALDGHPWFLENSASSGADGIAINATASCYTVSGY